MRLSLIRGEQMHSRIMSLGLRLWSSPIGVLFHHRARCTRSSQWASDLSVVPVGSRRPIVMEVHPHTFASGHTASNTPDPIRTRKLSCARPGQYWGGGPPGKPLGCCWLFRGAVCAAGGGPSGSRLRAGCQPGPGWARIARKY